MIIFSLKKEWYEKIKSGEKTIEYREVKPYWNNRIKNEVSKLLDNDNLQKNKVYYIPKVSCKLRLGYTNRYMTANIAKIEVVDGKKTAMKGCFVVGAYDGNNFSGTEYDSKNNELGQVSYNKEEFSENIQRFHIVRGEE